MTEQEVKDLFEKKFPNHDLELLFEDFLKWVESEIITTDEQGNNLYYWYDVGNYIKQVEDLPF